MVDPKLFQDAPGTSKLTFGDQAPASSLDWFEGFGKSALESLPELIGINPSPETQAFRRDNPVSGFASEMLGTAVPYLGWFKAAKYISPIAKTAERLGKLKSPFLAGAASTAATLAPFEAARVGANELVGDQSLTNMVGAAATDLALGSGIGGLLHGISAAGTRDPKLPSIFPGLDVSLPLPLMARQMRDMIDTGKFTTPESIGRARGKLRETLEHARVEELSPGQRYVGSIAHDAVPDAKTAALESQLNRIFRGGTGNPDAVTTRVRRFAAGAKKDFKSEFDWRTEAEEAGLPIGDEKQTGFQEQGQYFRQISFNRFTTKEGFDAAEKRAKDAARSLDRLVTNNMEAVGDGSYLTREADDGMFIVAKKYQGTPRKATPDDKWVLFKTDKPEFFFPAQERFKNLQVKLASWQPNSMLVDDAGPVYNTQKGFLQQYPLHDYRALTQPGNVSKIVNSLLPQNLAGKSNELVNRVGQAVGEYLTPRIQQFKKSARANRIVNAAKIAADAADSTASQLLYGKVKLDPGRDIVFNTLTGAKTQGLDGLVPLKQLTDTAGTKGVQEWVEKIYRNQVPVSQLDHMMTAGEISPDTAKFAKGLSAINDWRTTTTNKVEAATGRTPSEINPNLYGLPRQWEGDTRIIIHNDAGQVVAHASGPNRKAAQSAARVLVEKNPGWRIATKDGIPVEISESSDPAGVAKWLGGQDKALAEHQELRGFKWDLDLPTKEEFFKDYEAAIRRDMQYQSNMSTGDMLAGEMQALAREDSSAYRLVSARLNDYAGVMSSFGKWQNSVADKVLAPVVGTNSASKIVSWTNTAMFDLTLGAMKLAYPVVNALQFVQTVNPEAAFILGKAPAAELAGKYSFFAAGGQKGPIGGLGVLSPLKLMGSAMAEMRKPSAGLSSAIENAVNDGTLTPKVTEDYMGASAVKVTNLRAVLKGDESFLSWLRALSEFLPAESERLSRTHAFTVGYGIARDFLQSKSGEKLSAEQIYNFAKQFTENTMYLYSTADRPRVFTTPAGSALGLFKNWMFHYMASMGEYTGQAFNKNNWAPLLWQTGGTIGLGGLAASPLYGVADSFQKSWSDKSIMQLAYDHFDQNADWMLYGMPALAGLSMSSSVDVPALSNPVRDGSSLFSIAAWGRMKSLGTATKAAIDHWQATGEHPGYDRAVREDLAKAFAPTTVYRSLGAFANPDAIASVGSGYPIVKDPSLTNRLLYAAGFNPKEIQRGIDVSSALYESHQNLKDAEKKLGLAWAEAEMNGNSAQMSTTMRQGMTWGVDIGRVIKEGMFEIEKHRKDIIQRQLKPRDIGAWRKVMLGGEE